LNAEYLLKKYREPAAQRTRVAPAGAAAFHFDEARAAGMGKALTPGNLDENRRNA